jgi:hypothetical protein
MKLIIKNARIAGTATDDYTGPDDHIVAPSDFDITRLNEYIVTDGIASIPAITKDVFINQVDKDSDALVELAIGGRVSEYELAEREALVYKSAGYPDTDVPLSVSSWAIAKGYTNTVSADSIITTSTQWRTMQATIRAKRLLTKEQARNSADNTALDAIKNDWDTFVLSLRTSIGS